jgi:hypothetical protein
MMLRKVTAVLGAAAVFALAPMPAQSQIYLGPEIAWNDDADLGIGAGVEFDLPSLYPGIAFHGDFLYFFPGDDFDYFEVNTNLTYDFPLEDAAVVPFALAGLNIGRASIDSESPGIDGISETEVGFNLGGGIKFNVGSFQPRVAARFVLGGYEGFTIFGFLPFRIAN